MPTTPPAEFYGSTSPLDNHNLIATDKDDNMHALRDLALELRK